MKDQKSGKLVRIISTDNATALGRYTPSTDCHQLGEELVLENWVAAKLNRDLSPTLGQLVAPKPLYEVIP